METNINISVSVSVALLLMILAGCSSGSDDYDAIRNRVDWQQTEEYKTCKSEEEAAIKANKTLWIKYKSNLAKAKAEYPQKLAEYNEALKDYQQNGGLLPLVVPLPETTLMSPPLFAKGKCFNPPKNFQG